jgi:putative transposase
VQLSNAQLVIEVQKKVAALLEQLEPAREVRESLMAGTLELTPALGSAAACRAMGLWRGAPGTTQARAHRTAFVGPPSVPRPERPRSPLALSEVSSALVLQALCSERFADTAPAAVHATLLDEGIYLGSVRTMYRLLAANASSAERRRQRSHPAYAKPELLATRPTRSGRGTSPSSKAPPNGLAFICTSSWTSSAATWWAG